MTTDPLDAAVAEAIAQAQAGSPLLYRVGDDSIMQQRGQLQHWRGETLLAAHPKQQGWKKTLATMVRLAHAEASVAPLAPLPPPAPPPKTRPRRSPSRRSPPPAILTPQPSSEEETPPMAQLWTDGGYPLGEIISALQKDIRRGNEELAMEWALELVPRYENYLWRRLNVIVQEDIGIANVPLLALVPSQEAQFMRFREEGKDGTARLILANTILALCRSEKSRLADHFQCVVNQRRLHRAEKREIPDYALDKHTQRGKRLGRGVEHWRDEGCLLVPSAEVADPYADEAYQWWADPSFVQTQWGKKGRKGKATFEQDEIPF